MANRYGNIDGTRRISETYTQITEGFNRVQQDVDAGTQRADVIHTDIKNHKASESAHAAEHITYAGPIVGAEDLKSAVDSVKQQLDSAVMAGDSGAAASQAAIDVEGIDHHNLKARIDSDVIKLNTQLADTTAPYLNNGRLMLPTGFPSLPFGIYRRKYGEWYSDATPYNQFDWSDATHIYVVTSGASGAGTSATNPITLAQFKTNFSTGVYGSQTKFVLNLAESIYFANASSSNGITIDINADILIRASNATGFTWIGRIKSPSVNTQTSAWTTDGGVYKTTQTVSHDVLDVANLNTSEIPIPYHRKTTLSECQATKGTFYGSGVDVWVNPYNWDDINDLCLVISSSLLSENQSNPRVLMLENIGFVASAFATATGGNINTSFYYFGCKWYRSLANAFYKQGIYKTYLFNCVAAYATLDCFNYHTTDKRSVAVEVNCLGFGAGQYKLTTGQPTHSNNGSTAHDGMYALRVGSRYYDCEGPIVADVNNCYSISISVEASDILSSSTGVMAAFQFYNTGSMDLAQPKYVIECKGYGKNVDYGIVGTDQTFAANFVGVTATEGGVKGREDIIW